MLRINTRSPRRRNGARGSEGFTLLEIIVAVAVLAIIVVPLTMAFVGIFTNTQSATEALNRNNDAQRIAAAWTADVQSVLPGGVNPADTDCVPPLAGTAPESALITFHWTTTANTQATTSTTNVGTGGEVDMIASWVAVGTGRSTSLWRRECVNGTMVREQRLAENIGEPGQQGIDVIHGPAQTSENPSPHTARSFCPYVIVGSGPNPQLVGKTCTIVVDGSWKYDLEVARRVPEITDANALRQAPAAPRNLTGTPRNHSIVARFESPIMQTGQPPVDRYRVRAVPANGGSPVDVLVGPGDDPMLVTIDGLSNSVQYMISVQAHNAVGWGDWTAEVGPLQPLATEPNAPTIVSVTPGDKQVEVRFTPPDNDGGSPIIAWHLYGQGNDGTWLNDTGGIVSPLVFSVAGGPAPAVTQVGSDFVAVFPGLTNGTPYHFFVAGVNAVHQNTTAPNPPLVIQPGEGLLSERSIDVTPYGPPDHPSGVEARGLNPSSSGGEQTAQITVRWAPPADTNGTLLYQYRVLTYRGQGATTPVDPQGELVYVTDAGCPGSQPTDTCQITRTYPISSSSPSDYYRFSVKTIARSPDNVIIEGDESPKSTPYGVRRVPPALPDYVRPSRAPDPVTDTPSVTRVGANLRATFDAPFNGGEPIERVRLIYRTRSTAPGSPSSGNTELVLTPTGSSTLSVDFPAPSPGFFIDVRVAVGNRGEWVTSSSFRFGGLSPYSAGYLIPGAPGRPNPPTLYRPSNSLGTELVVGISAPADDGGSTITGYDVTCSVSGNSALTVTRHFTAAGSQTIIGAGGGGGNSGTLRDGAPYSCTVAAVNAQGAGTASYASAVATSFGECFLKANASHYMIDGYGDQDGTYRFQVSEHWSYWWWGTVEQKQRWGAINFGYNSNCEGKSGGMPTTAKVKDAVLRLTITTSRNRSERLVRATSSWNESTPWSSRPTTGGELINWCADSDGTKSLSNSSITAAIDDMVHGNSPYGFVIQDRTNCGISVNRPPVEYAGRTSSDPPAIQVTKFYTQGDY
ncbi:MAG: fibronectin type III domain-containing protein [Acidimicrobiales bacterium]|nr:fibronectin type III domain-containing protein [Acidimicrobiales bacterium]